MWDRTNPADLWNPAVTCVSFLPVGIVPAIASDAGSPGLSFLSTSISQIAAGQTLMSVALQQSPISGVSPTSEAVIATIYPSISATATGLALGKLYESIPTCVWGMKVSNLIFCLPSIPLALHLYFLLKVFGERYTLTNRSVQIWNSLGNQKKSEVPLNDIASVNVYQGAGHLFFKAGDLYLIGKSGEHLAILKGVPYPQMFKGTIDEMRDARSMVAAALDRIKARG